jgi:hypothetical protein
MRLVMRFLVFEFSLAWVMVLAGLARAGVQVWPFFADALRAGLRAWRVYLGVLIGFPVLVGWPLLFWLQQSRPGYQGWLGGIAIPWWIVLGASALVALLAKIGAHARYGAGHPGCSSSSCISCAPREKRALSSRLSTR